MICKVSKRSSSNDPAALPLGPVTTVAAGAAAVARHTLLLDGLLRRNADPPDGAKADAIDGSSALASNPVYASFMAMVDWFVIW